MESPVQEPAQFDAFISYSRKDMAFANKLVKALRAYKPPPKVEAPQRYLRIFQDVSDLTGTEYSQSIERQLQNSAKLIVLCSPESRKSEYVDDEIRRFAKLKGAENIIPILVAGVPNNEAGEDQEEDKAFPEAMVEAMGMPLATSYLGFNPRKDKVNKGVFSNSWYTLLANLYDISRNEIEQRDLKRQIRRRNIAITIVSIVMVMLTGLTVYAFWQRNTAIHQAKVALSRQLAVQAEKLFALDFFNLALLLSIEALEITNTAEAVSALFTVLQDQPQIKESLKGIPSEVTSVALSPDGKIYASGNMDNTIGLLEIPTGQPLRPSLTGHLDKVTSMAFSPNGKFLVSASLDNTIRLWDVATHRLMHTLRGHTAGIYDLAVSPDGKILASVSYDRTIRLWVVEKLMPLGPPLHGHQEWLDSVAFSPDGKTLASGSNDRTIILWDVATRQPLGPPLQGHQDRVISLAFSPDGKLLASVTSDNNIILWDVNTREQLGSPIEKYEQLISSMAFGPDSKNFATGREDGTVLLWDIKKFIPLGPPFKGHKQKISSLAFSPDGQTLLSASADETILWRVSAKSLLKIARQLCKRNLTEKEWRRYMGDDVPYRKTCPDLPGPDEKRAGPSPSK